MKGAENKSVTCPRCKEKNNPQFNICWKCGGSFHSQDADIGADSHTEPATHGDNDSFLTDVFINYPVGLWRQISNFKSLVINIGGIVGAVIGLAIGKYVGLNTIYALAVALLSGWIANKFAKPASKPFVAAFAVQAGLLFWNVVGLVLLGRLIHPGLLDIILLYSRSYMAHDTARSTLRYISYCLSSDKFSW